MEKENLDDLMREKFDTDNPGARFEFREEYWEQAQALLEADERKRKRRFLWWWWLGAGCLLLAVGGWFAYAGRNESSQPGAAQVTSQSKGNDTTNAQATNELGGNPNNLNTKPIEQGRTGAAPDGQLSEMSTTEAETPKTAENHTGPNTQPAASGHLTGKSPIRQDKQRFKSSGLPTATATAPQPTPTGLPTGNTGLPTETATAPQTTSLPAENTGLPTAGSPQPTGQPVEDVENVAVVDAPTMEGLQKIHPIDFQTLATLPSIPFLPKAIPTEREIRPLREPRLSIGLGASAAAFFPKNKALQLGGTAGIFADYRLSRSFSLTAGAAWRYIPVGGIVADSTYPSEVSEQLRYSFGYVKTQSSIRPQGLHTLELPIALRWHRDAWYLEGGAVVSRVLGVRADLMEQQSTSLQPLPVTTKKKIWADDQPYRQVWVSPMLGAGWQRGRWSVSLRAMLLPADIAPPLIPDEPRASGWRPSMDVGLRYRIW